ncbi:MAG: hypothetical protein LV480_09205 [Methylacidiphilales bacterium]|nr:hypothetical protein [Candidatus Methylacidiphilales bacterium]
MSDATLQPKIKAGWYFGVFAAFLIFALIAGYSARMTHEYSDFDDQRSAARYETLKKVREDAEKTLTTADWIDQSKGIIRIPIDEAMAHEIDTLKGQPAQAGAEINPPTPAPAPSTNAAPAKPAPPGAKPAAPAPAKTTT